MRPSDLSLMIFAAGFGTRMGALVRDRPKPLVEVAGRPLIDHALALARNAGIRRIVVNAHYRADDLARHLAGAGVTLLHESPHILDTGGGLRNALPHLGTGPVFTLNPDALWTGPDPFHALSERWRPGMGALLSVVPGSRTHGRDAPGDFARDAAGLLRRGGDLVYTGAEIIDTACLATIDAPAFSLSRVWDDLAGRDALHGVEHAGHWADVGHPGGIADAEAMLADA